MNVQFKNHTEFLSMKNEIKILKDKVQSLAEENIALREINVQFQLENFKLQKKIDSLQNSRLEECSQIEYDEDVRELIEDDAYNDPTAEYLEHDFVLPQTSTEEKNSLLETSIPQDESKKFYHDDYSSDQSSINEEDNIIENSLQICKAINKTIENEQINEDSETVESEESLDPKDAVKIIYTKAAKRGVLDKIKSIQPGKKKDSYFVSKILDLFFDRKVLAHSSAKGQKCQRYSIPARPPLDPSNVEICRKAFSYRLQREGLSHEAHQKRFKYFYGYVNFKIQNSRKICATCISEGEGEGEADRFKKCLQDYAAKTGQLDAYCETKISEFKESIDDYIKSILKKENMTKCGWKLFEDNKVDEIALNAFIQQYTTSTIDEKALVKEFKKTFKYFLKFGRTYCFSDLYIGNAFNYEVGGRHPNSSLTQEETCMMKYLIDINIIDPKLYNIDEGIYANENCESLFVEWRQDFPCQFKSFVVNFPDEIFGLPSTKFRECWHQKLKEQKLKEKYNELLASYKLLVTLGLSEVQIQEIRSDYITLYKNFIINLFECLEKIF
ncbi:CLUMA_CG009992, isoform A [Clunio marinus]|uniref:CLUMA_CG009992, isoform A n=1 Tax=Clunio marinus TaxID=568069 RepID=A0A1J1IE39_9DIPT|nr:CLUMA_CG009992, isoform A [Clunio marinus]